MPILTLHRRQLFKLSIPYWVFLNESSVTSAERINEHPIGIMQGMEVSIELPQGLCPEAWKTMKEFVEALANGEGNFYDGWMKNPYSAMISCNDGFRLGSFCSNFAAFLHTNQIIFYR